MIISKFYQLGSNSINVCNKIILDISGLETYNNKKITSVSSIELSDYIHIEGNFNILNNNCILFENVKYIIIKNNVLTIIKEIDKLLNIIDIINLKTDNIKLILKDI